MSDPSSPSRALARITSDDEADPTSLVNPQPGSPPIEQPSEQYAEESEPEEEEEEEEFEPEEEAEPQPDEAYPTPTGSPLPVPQPTAPSPTIPTQGSPSRIHPRPASPPPERRVLRRVNSRDWAWMPGTLHDWKEHEGIPILPMPHSPPAPISPFTQEPAHFTIPILVIRSHHHGHLIQLLDRDEREHHLSTSTQIRALQQQVTSHGTDISGVTGTLDATREELHENIGEVADLRMRLDQYEQRLIQSEQIRHLNDQRIAELEQTVVSMAHVMERVPELADAASRIADAIVGVERHLG